MREFLASLPPNLRKAVQRQTVGVLGKYGRYAYDPEGFIRDVLHEALWSKQREICRSVLDNPRTAVPACFAPGKCLDANERITLYDGSVRRVGDLVGLTAVVPGYGNDSVQRPRRARFADNGIQPRVRVVLASGRVVVRTPEHPLMAAKTWSGKRAGKTGVHVDGAVWREAQKVEVGDVVLVPVSLSVAACERMPDDEVKLAGYLVGDGGTTVDVRFTNVDSDVVEEYRACAEAQGCRIVTLQDGITYGARSVIAGEKNPLLSMVRRWGINCRSREKRFPAFVWRLPDDQLAMFLSRYFACDGWASIRTTGQRRDVNVAVASASEGLIQDVELACLRLGIFGKTRRRGSHLPDGRSYSSWEWSCHPDSVEEFAAKVGMFTAAKQAKLAECVDIVRSRARHPRWAHEQAPSGYRWDVVRSVEHLPAAPTVSIEVEHDQAFVTTVVEHNTHLAARLVLWWGSVWPAGTAKVVTTATTYRTVKNQLWPHIRRVHGRHKLPGKTNLVEWQVGRELVAFGFSAPNTDPESVQGYHEPHLLIVVDEAGGITHAIGGALNGLMTGMHTRMLAIGNPSSDEQDTWFQGVCESPEWHTIPIAVEDTPNFTGEDAGPCLSCPPGTPPHPVAGHLVDEDWLRVTVGEYGEDHPYVVAKVHAGFPEIVANRTIPLGWLEEAIKLGREEPATGTRVRLGVDIASDGGDELAIARVEGLHARVVHTESGKSLANSVDVAGIILEEIRVAEARAKELGSTERVRVKVDVIGLGWGPVSTLKRWGEEGLHNAEVVGVNVGERARQPDKYVNQRAEMWWEGRLLFQPNPDQGGKPMATLDVDERTKAQLGDPTHKTSTAGRRQIESKADLRKRGRKSPDRAEAVLLAYYEPPTEDDDKMEILV